MKRFLVVGVLGGLLMLPLPVNKMAAICLTTTDNGLLPVGVQPLVSDILKEWRAGSIVSRKEVLEYGLDSCFCAMPIPANVFRRMKGRSYKNDCTVRLSDLRYVRLLHYDFKGQVKLGELICNKSVSDDLVEIFRELFEHHYPIESVLLVDNFEANDEMSMRANNSSCFNYRVVKGSSKLSLHSQGRAIDINPLYNPCVRLRTHTVQPATGRRYANRKDNFPYKISPSDICYQLFVKHGFRWGGNWKTIKDYQHFER